MRQSLVGLTAGIALLASAATAAAPFAYVPNCISNNVSIIDVATNNVVSTIALPGALCPMGVAANTANTKVYFANKDNNTVSVLDIATGVASPAVAAPGISLSYGIAVNPAGTRAYVTGLGSGSLAVFNLTTTPITHITTLTGLSSPFGMAINPTGTRVYVAENNNFRVAVLDATSNTLLAPIATPGVRPLGIAIDASGDNLWIGHYASPGYVTRVSNLAGTPSVGAAIATGGDSPTGIAVNASGSKVYAANQTTDTVTVIDTATGIASAPVAAGDGPAGISISPDGTRVLVGNYNSDNVSIFDGNLNLIATTVVGDYPYAHGIFIAQSPPPATADITGTITNSLGGGAMSGITVANSGAASTSTNGSGVYSFTGLAAGSYTITPSVYNYVFSPLSRTVNLAGVNATGQNFTGTYNGIPDITDLRALVVAANLTDTRVRNSLLAPLDAALVWLNGTNPNKVAYSCSNLAKFIATVRQNISVGKLPAATGNPWIVAANDILSLSGCPTR